jgi:Mannosyltransferase putative
MIDLLRIAPNLNTSVCSFLTAECRTLTQVWQVKTTHVYQPRIGHLPKPFPYKPAAILSSTFSEVLFLDCDAYVTRDPEELFLSDPMYHKFGALFFPDALKSRQHPAVWNLFNTTCAQDEHEFDSSAILVDKKRVWNGLYMTKLMNDDYELFYKVFHYYYAKYRIVSKLF